MKVSKIQGPQFKAYRINRIDNKEITYLNNRVMDIFDKQQIPMVYTNEYIQFDRITNHIKYKLKKMGIKFYKIKDKK